MKRFLLVLTLLLTMCFSAYSQSATFNTIATAYVTSTISQVVVFDSNMQTGGTLDFTVQAHNGGGRAGQADTANLRIQFYNSSNTLLGTQQTNYSGNLPIPAGVCGQPCADTNVPWTTLQLTVTNCGGSCASVAYARVAMYGIDGSYWAGDYGPWYQQPILKLNGGNNILYNPEFGPYNGVSAQGWTVSPALGVCQGAWGGSNPCIVNNPGVTANQNEGGPSTTGGTTASTPGGYTSAPAAPVAPALCCGGSADPFTANSNNVAKITSFMNRPTQDSQVYINQIGDANKITVDQTGTKNNYTSYVGNGSNNTIDIKQSSTSPTAANYTDLHVVGNTNNVNIQQTSTGGIKGAFVSVQDNNNVVTLKQQDGGSHYADISVSGGSKTVDVTQQGSGNHMASITLTGLPASLTLQQAGSTQQFYSINYNCATSGGCAPISVTQGK